MTSKSSEALDSEAEADNAATAKQPTAGQQRDPVKRFTWLVFGLIVLLALWYFFADRYAPWTDQARVQAWVVPIAPKVSGKVVKVNANIMGKNWLHVRDGSGEEGTNDLTITSAGAVPAVGDTVLVTGTLGLNRDFGMGYQYPVIVEDAEVTVEMAAE